MFLSLKKLISAKKISPNLRQIIFNTGWLFFDRIFQMGLALFIGIWVTRYLGPEQFGLFNYALAFTGLFGVFANLGLDGIVVREIVRQPSAKDEILGTTFVLRLISCAASILLAIGIIFVLRPNDSLTHFLVAILTFSSFFNAFPIDVWFQAQVQSKKVVLSRNIAYVLICVVRVVLVYTKAPLIAFAWASLAEVTLSALAQVIAYQSSNQSIYLWKYSTKRAKELLMDGWPLIISGMVIIIYMRTDQIMLGQMMGDREVGIYSAAAKISEMWIFVPGAIVNSVFPSIVRAKEVSKELCDQRMQKLFSLMTILAYSVAIPITFTSNQIVTILYGDEFIEAAPILAVHVWTGVFISLGLARTPWIISEGLMRFSAVSSTVGAVINIILNYFLIPNFGAMGASVATVVAQIVSSYLMHAIHPKTKSIFVMQTKALIGLDWGQGLLSMARRRS
jgi:O-antigen/teichoic acid export membrane protein